MQHFYIYLVVETSYREDLFYLFGNCVMGINVRPILMFGVFHKLPELKDIVRNVL